MTNLLRQPASSLANVLLSDSQQSSLLAACGTHPGTTCQIVWDVTHSTRAASFTNAFLDGPVKLGLRIAFVIVLALIIRAILVRIVRRITDRAAQGPVAPLRPVTRVRRWRARHHTRVTQARAGKAPASARGPGVSSPGEADVTDPAGPDVVLSAAAAQPELIEERRKQRLRALQTILTSAISVVIFTIVGLQVLSDMDIDLTPLLASASVAGVAIGFGAQSMVKDYLAGILMLLEDQYGVGDVVTIGEVTGTVEAVSLRTTRLRDVSGVVWHIPNGSFDEVGNESQGWARAVIDFPVPYSADITEVRPLLDTTATTMWHDPYWREVMLEKPEVWGIQEISTDDVTMRVVVRTAPLRQWELERELRARIKAALDAAGIKPEPSESSS
jgi:moderate conductance mechanosensitive channel